MDYREVDITPLLSKLRDIEKRLAALETKETQASELTEHYFSHKEAAKFIGRKPSSLYQLVHQGIIIPIKQGRVNTFSRSSLVAYMAKVKNS